MNGVNDILLAALKQALLDPDNEQRLVRAGRLEGLFPSRSGTSGEALSHALSEHLLEVVRRETKGKIAVEWVRLPDANIGYLYGGWLTMGMLLTLPMIVAGLRS